MYTGEERELQRHNIKRAIRAIKRSTADAEDKKIAIDYLRNIYRKGGYFLHNSNTLSGSFTWMATPQGSVFWGRLHSAVGNFDKGQTLRAGDYTVDVQPNGIQVGCQKVTWEQYKALKKAVQKSGYAK